MPALQPCIMEAIWEQFSALLPERKTDHPLGCHRPRIPDRVVFEKVVEVLVFGCAYWRIADEECSATRNWRQEDQISPLNPRRQRVRSGLLHPGSRE